MKSKTHVYMANLLIEDLKRGGLTFPEEIGYFVPPQEITSAILNFPAEFRAGSAGPDFYPDIEIGQTIIHPKNSGQWLIIMFEEFAKLSSRDPERKKALSFLLGFMMHYSADLYGHEYVNRWAKGWFPDFKEALSDNEKMQKIVRHILVETYMDSKVPKDQNTKLSYPRKFVKQCFLNPNALALYETTPKLLYADQLRKYTIKALEKNSTNILLFNYFSSWQQDLERGIDSWLDTWHNITNDLIANDRTMEDAKKEIINWSNDYLKYMTPIPDVFIDIEKFLSSLNILKPITDAIKKEVIIKLINESAKAIVKAATGREVNNAIELCEDILKKPELYLNNGILYEDRNITDQLDTEFGNFGQCSDTLNQTFFAFSQCLNMGKLCLIGPENLNRIIEKAKGKKQHTFKNLICKGSIEELIIDIKTKKNGWFSNHGCGTDDDIYFELCVGCQEELKLLLDKPNYNDFESGNWTTYNFKLPRRVDYSEVLGFRLKKVIKFNDDWTPEWIRITDQENRVLCDKEINVELKGSDCYESRLDLKNLKEYKELPMDHTIISFLYSLDGAGKTDTNNPTQYKQWTEEGNVFYTDLVLREEIYKKLFEDEKQYAYVPR